MRGSAPNPGLTYGSMRAPKSDSSGPSSQKLRAWSADRPTSRPSSLFPRGRSRSGSHTASIAKHTSATAVQPDRRWARIGLSASNTCFPLLFAALTGRSGRGAGPV